MTGGPPNGNPVTPPLVFAGAATLDMVALVAELPQPDTRCRAEAVTQAGGGPAATAAVTAARLGLPAAFIGAVGDDETGERILAELTAERVDITGVHVAAGQPSAASVVLVESSSQTRAICNQAGPPLVLGAAAVSLLRSARWVHADHVGWAGATRALADLPRAQRPAVSVDGGNDIDGLVLDRVDLYVPTVAALSRRYGHRAASDLLAAALADGAGTVVATAGGGGCIAAAADGTRAELPAHPATVRSTLGAGDVFHGALVAALARDMELRAALAYASAAAALSCAGLDGRSAIGSHDDVMTALAAYSASTPAAQP